MRLTFRKFFGMDRFLPFELPVFGLEHGLHEFHFEVDDAFFSGFEQSPVERGRYDVKLELDRRENEFVLDFDIRGSFSGPCDRCLADIDVASSIRKIIWVKYGTQSSQDQPDEDLVIIDESEHFFNVAGLIHELIILSLPLVNRYACENDPEPKCDFKVLAYLDQERDESESNEVGNDWFN